MYYNIFAGDGFLYPNYLLLLFYICAFSSNRIVLVFILEIVLFHVNFMLQISY